MPKKTFTYETDLEAVTNGETYKVSPVEDPHDWEMEKTANLAMEAWIKKTIARFERELRASVRIVQDRDLRKKPPGGESGGNRMKEEASS